MKERSEEEGNREARPKDEMHGVRVKARKGFSQYPWQWSRSDCTASWLFFPEVRG